MPVVNMPEALYSFQARGKFGFPAGCGVARVGHAKCGADSLNAGVYQIRRRKGSQIVVRMKYYRPTNPQTVPQQANRTKFADAMSAWQALTDEQKSAYTNRAKKLQLYGRNLFIREYYQSN